MRCEIRKASNSLSDTNTVVPRATVIINPPLYLNRALQRPMTSPWQTSSALNSDPSSVR